MTRKSERNKNEATKIFAADDEHIEGGQNDNLVDEVLKIADDDNQEVGYAIGMPQEAYSFKKKKKKLISFAYKILLPGLLLYLVYTKLQLSQKNEQLETVLGNLETKEMKMNEAIKASSEVSESEYAELAEDEQKVEYLENTIAKLEMQRKENKMETNKLEILLQQGNKKLEKKMKDLKAEQLSLKQKQNLIAKEKEKIAREKEKMEKKQEKIIEVEEKIEEEREEFEDEKELQRDILETQNIPKKMEKEENIGKIALGITPGIVYDNPSSGSMGRIIKKYETTTFAKKERNQNSLLGRPISYRECPKKTNKYFYKQPKKCIDMNIVFLKGPKVAGSVIGGIARQIALRQNINCPHCFLDTAIKIGEPKVVANHIGSKEKMIHLDMNTRKDTFKFTMFREPLKRCLSNYEHHKVRDGFGHKEATVNRFIHYARKECNDRLFKYYALAFKPMAESLDFIGVTERTDESVLAIAHMLKLGMGDVLYHATKVANSGKGYNGHNVDLNDKKIKNFTKYDFSRNNVNDLAYWQKANTNLDDIIHKVGRSRFNLQLKNFKEHVQRANAVCKANICLWSDNGCAFPCFTEYSNAHNLYAPISDKDWKPVDIDLSFTPTVKNWVPSEHHGRENLTYVPSK